MEFADEDEQETYPPDSVLRTVIRELKASFHPHGPRGPWVAVVWAVVWARGAIRAPASQILVANPYRKSLRNARLSQILVANP